MSWQAAAGAVASFVKPGLWGCRGLARMFTDEGVTASVPIELPSGARVQGETMSGGFRCAGRLGACRLRTGYGDIRVEEAGPVHLTSDSGEITVERATGHAEIATESGEIRIPEIDGTASISDDDGECHVGEITGDLRLIGINGDMRVDRAHGGVEAKNVYGSVLIEEVVRGSVVLTGTTGDLEAGIRQGTATWFDVSTATGRLLNFLGPCGSPEGFAEAAEIRARSHDGDISIRRARQWNGRLSRRPRQPSHSRGRRCGPCRLRVRPHRPGQVERDHGPAEVTRRNHVGRVMASSITATTLRPRPPARVVRFSPVAQSAGQSAWQASTPVPATGGSSRPPNRIRSGRAGRSSSATLVCRFPTVSFRFGASRPSHGWSPGTFGAYLVLTPVAISARYLPTSGRPASSPSRSRSGPRPGSRRPGIACAHVFRSTRAPASCRSWW
ncbi:hypothetical protein HNP84_005961 [Thermocatellispora tengchongensis]|uniref:DUF4097 domain-containing protein n=1 Tax=Thermocatellispora tengchongensis TaxID=1073253 RepID=A0A840PGF1_9ACTN|nr:DUF4097 family beta strand repeat-containing protein [Thermocatellispora tengchongensis]MBB5136217.1 hypothetical protein [Thermocatellispora tengchongensis]